MRNESINNIIENYIRKRLSPQPDERQFITDKFEELCGFLKEYKDAIFKNGSWARFTAVHPVSDLDAVWPLPIHLRPAFKFSDVVKKKIDPHSLDVSNILKDLAKRLDREYKIAGNNVIILPQSHSVGIFFSPDKQGFSIDLVPAIPTGEVNEYGDDIYYVPEILKMSKKHRQLAYKMAGERNEPINWIKTDPKGYITDSTKVNDLNEAYRKSAKFTKAWNYGCKDTDKDHPLKSFHLELMCREIILADTSISTHDAITGFFNSFEEYLESPRFPDRADKNRYVDSYVIEITDSQRLSVVRHISKAVILLQRLEDVSSESEAQAILDNVLGGDNPLPDISIKPVQRVVTPSGAWSM
ncbi:MAG TPA: hypothetical protein VMW41_07085 [Candidatus Bathyarchaeia archaeon]|nr:hypothetical protein [Candidatus Bathyarchaeia archaeon]